MTQRSVRIATWNVHGLRGGVPAVAQVVRAERVDILLIQESGPHRRLRALGAALGMAVCADPPAFPRRRVQNAVLVGPALEVRSFELVRFEEGSFVHPRGAMIAELSVLTVISVHLGLAGTERRRHAAQLLERVRGTAGPIVIGGDLNARPEDAAPTTIAASHPDVWTRVGDGEGRTFPSDRPTARIDYLFTGAAVQALRAWTAGGRASDHLMVIADLEVTGARGPPR